LWWASSKGHKEVVEMLLAHGANVDPLGCGQVQESRTPLWIAAKFGHKEVVEALLQAGADASFCNSEGRSPLRAAVEEGHVEVVAVLAPHGADAADMNHTDARGRTPLWIAAEEGLKEVVEMLLAHGANVTTPDEVRASLLLVHSCPNGLIALFRAKLQTLTLLWWKYTCQCFASAPSWHAVMRMPRSPLHAIPGPRRHP
jgi:hypothetical protein